MKGLGIILFNVTFNNISVISWRSVLLVEETGEPGENNENEMNCRQNTKQKTDDSATQTPLTIW